MGGFFGVVSKQDCVTDLFFGIDFHSHLGTSRGGMAVYSQEDGFNRIIHNIENAPFRTKFELDVLGMHGSMGIGCISDSDPQPLIVRSHLGTYAITTVGRINNQAKLMQMAFENGGAHFLEMSGGKINATEIVASLINQKNSMVEGMRYAQEMIDGSMSILTLVQDGIYAARDKHGRTPLVIGEKDGGYCVTFESFAYYNLGYQTKRELGAGEIAFVSPYGVEQLSKPCNEKMKVCAFLWMYYGYPTSSYEGRNVELTRYVGGEIMAANDDVDVDLVGGIPDSGTPHAIGYSHKSGIPFGRPFIKYTPTWSRSFIPQNQSMRNLVAHMKLIPVESFIRDKRLLLIDDSLVRGTQLRQTAEYLHSSGAKEVHIRPACPPLMYGCKYLNFSRSTSEYELITRQVIQEMEGDKYDLQRYTDESTAEYRCMVERIGEKLGFTSLKYQTLSGMMESIGLDPSKICTYCWTGK